MYKVLAHVYDALFSDKEATALWADFVEEFVCGHDILELACGSGDVMAELSKRGYHVLATDLSEDMVQVAKEKYGDIATYQVMDMKEMDITQQFDGILSFCDSMNYILDELELLTIFQKAYAHLKPNGYLLFDMHSIDRLQEFKEGYVESGHAAGYDYQWEIDVEDDMLKQTFAFYKDNQTFLEHHIQRVYDARSIEELLKKVGFCVTIKTDFSLEGIQEGEKYFFVCRKGSEDK